VSTTPDPAEAGAPDALSGFLAGAVAGLLEREGFRVHITVDAGDYQPEMHVANAGHWYQIRLRYAGPMSTEQLAAIAARNGIQLTTTGEPGEFLATAAPAVPWEVAQHVLFTFEGTQYAEPGSFTTRLIECLKHADPANLRLLARVYPDYALAVSMYQREDGGRDELVAIAKHPPARDPW